MTGYDLMELAGRNLRESKLRNSLTTLGIAVGVASLVAMLSLGVGLQQLANNRLNRSGIFDTVVVFSKRDISSFDTADRRAGPQSNETSRALDEAARREMAALPNVLEVYPEMRFPTEVRIGEKTQFTTVAGLPLSAKQNEAFDEMQGSFFSSATAEEAILQLDFAKRVSPAPKDLLGKELVLRYAQRQALNGSDADAAAQPGEDVGFSVVRREKKLKIVGIVENEPFGGMRNFARGRVFLPIQVAEGLNILQTSTLRDAVSAGGQNPTYMSLLVRLDGPSHAQQVQDAIKKMGFTTWSVLDATKSLRRFFVILDLFLGIFGSLAIAVASLGIINTLVMAILERRREIGIMKALGASDVDVKRLFFTEAGVMGLLGGVLGVVLGYLMGRLINLATNIYLQRQALPPENIWIVPWWLVAGAIGFAILVSLVSGLYPAARAARLDPVQALRYE